MDYAGLGLLVYTALRWDFLEQDVRFAKHVVDGVVIPWVIYIGKEVGEALGCIRTERPQPGMRPPTVSIPTRAVQPEHQE